MSGDDASMHRQIATAQMEIGPKGVDLVYLYCVIEPGSTAHGRAVSGDVPGLVAECPLFAVEAAGLVAVVSRVPASLFQGEPLEELLADLTRLAPFAVRHQTIVAMLREHAPAIVPISFGAVYRGEENVARLVREGAGRFRKLLDEVRGRQEWGLKLFGDAERLRQAAVRESAEVQRLLADEADAGPGRAYLLAKRRERAVAEAEDRFIADTCNTIVQNLAARSTGVRIEEPAVRATESEDLFVLAAFLVDDDAVDGFLERAAQLRDAYQPFGLRLDFSGPWAPYTFVRESSEEEVSG